MDVGKVLNPAIARGQIAGAIAMALSYAKAAPDMRKLKKR